MAQMVASMSGVVLGGVAEVVGSNLARGKMFTASIGSVISLRIYIYKHKRLYLHRLIFINRDDIYVPPLTDFTLPTI